MKTCDECANYECDNFVGMGWCSLDNVMVLNDDPSCERFELPDDGERGQSVKSKDMTKANVKFVCGLVFSLTMMCLAGKYFQEGKYGWFVFDVLTIIPWAYLMISGYKDLPEK